ncbi:hypothetical protein [Rhodohalobacter sp.]|uniref:hypothetical protein n=1 Tax=Rhodohalobacter sp. TaxID=1974210 RepID=UPI002ACE035A|nr:hypothetical protein [Rhodohalobacter sp.]MDZ7756789.1 hypothetical protein [Rhodohalobacter sp.]
MFVKNQEITASTKFGISIQSLYSAIVLYARLNPINELMGYDVHHGYAIFPRPELRSETTTRQLRCLQASSCRLAAKLIQRVAKQNRKPHIINQITHGTQGDLRFNLNVEIFEYRTLKLMPYGTIIGVQCA